MLWFRLVYPMLKDSLDCPFVIYPSVFSDVYLLNFEDISLFLLLDTLIFTLNFDNTVMETVAIHCIYLTGI